MVSLCNPYNLLLVLLIVGVVLLFYLTTEQPAQIVYREYDELDQMQRDGLVVGPPTDSGSSDLLETPGPSTFPPTPGPSIYPPTLDKVSLTSSEEPSDLADNLYLSESGNAGHHDLEATVRNHQTKTTKMMQTTVLYDHMPDNLAATASDSGRLSDPSHIQNTNKEPGQKLPYFGSSSQRNVLIVSTWRSGSTTFSSILSSLSSSFLHYEPLDGHFTRSLTDLQTTTFTRDVTDKLLSCNYSAIDLEYLKGMYFRRAYLKENNKVPGTCKGKRVENPCLNQTFMSELCMKYPDQMIKYVRVSLAQVEHYLDEYANFKIIWLVRDPRAVWYSRINNNMVNFWCLPGLCGDLERLCESYQINWDISERLRRLKPESFLRVRFEDFQARPRQEGDRIIKFLGIKESTDIFNKISQLENRTKFTTKKDWRDNMIDSLRKKVEVACSGVMRNLDYI